MKAVILAGGYATRLWPITKNRPKMFLPIGCHTVIDHIFAELERDDRIEEVYVSTNEEFADDFDTHITESTFEKPRLSIEETTSEDEKPGVVSALAQLVDREEIDDDLLVIAGDNLLSFHISSFIDFFQTVASPSVAAYDVRSRERATSYGVLELKDGLVTDFQEKPTDPTSTLVSIGCYGFPAATLESLQDYLKQGNNPDEPGWFIQWLHDKTDVRAFTFDEAWFDIGTRESYLSALAWQLDDGPHVASSATVRGSDLGENVMVMAGSEIIDATLHNVVVFPETAVCECDIRSSIIDSNVELVGLTLRESLVDSHTQILNDRSQSTERAAWRSSI
ncbi:sugar phosphate nucleotidyltransferase [Haloarchaeobius amylolyticus]|uniref:Sugar phosphate nucleotidyltransferase n=1 Tax=Haloarchaeobius amylolyticus TaxID=1198296 RepID=A0ABD6BI21_9EURY